MKCLITFLLIIATVHAQFSFSDSLKFFQQSLPLVRESIKLFPQLTGKKLKTEWLKLINLRK